MAPFACAYFWCVCAQIDLSGNALCGITVFEDGAYNAEGIKAIADAMGVSRSLTHVILSNNIIDDEGAVALGHAMRDSQVCRLQKLELRGCDIGAAGTEALAAGIAVSRFLVFINLTGNSLADVCYVRPNMLEDSFFEVGGRVTYKGQQMIVANGINDDGNIEIVDLCGVKALADVIAVNRSLTRVQPQPNLMPHLIPLLA